MRIQYINLCCSSDEAAPFAHIAEELITTAARINAHREATSSALAVDCPSGSRETVSLGPQARQDAGSRPEPDGARIVWDSWRLQCVWRCVQHYHIQMSGQLPDLKKLLKELGTSGQTITQTYHALWTYGRH